MRPCDWKCQFVSETQCFRPTDGISDASSCRPSPEAEDKTKPACIKTCVPPTSLNDYDVCNGFCVKKDSEYYIDNSCVNNPLTTANDVTYP